MCIHFKPATLLCYDCKFMRFIVHAALFQHTNSCASFVFLLEQKKAHNFFPLLQTLFSSLLFTFVVFVAADFIQTLFDDCHDNSNKSNNNGFFLFHKHFDSNGNGHSGFAMSIQHRTVCILCIMSPHKPCSVCSIFILLSCSMWCFASVCLPLLVANPVYPLVLAFGTAFWSIIVGAFIAAIMCYFYYCATIISKPIIEIKQI